MLLHFAKTKEELLDICFNAFYLLDLVNAIEDSVIRVKIKDANTACLAETEDGKYSFLVMPMRG